MHLRRDTENKKCLKKLVVPSIVRLCSAKVSDFITRPKLTNTCSLVQADVKVLGGPWQTAQCTCVHPELLGWDNLHVVGVDINFMESFLSVPCSFSPAVLSLPQFSAWMWQRTEHPPTALAQLSERGWRWRWELLCQGHWIKRKWVKWSILIMIGSQPGLSWS